MILPEIKYPVKADRSHIHSKYTHHPPSGNRIHFTTRLRSPLSPDWSKSPEVSLPKPALVVLLNLTILEVKCQRSAHTHGKCAAVVLRMRPTAGFPSLNPVVYLIGCSHVSGRSLSMYLGGIGVFIKLIHVERATQREWSLWSTDTACVWCSTHTSPP